MALFYLNIFLLGCTLFSCEILHLLKKIIKYKIKKICIILMEKIAHKHYLVNAKYHKKFLIIIRKCYRTKYI